MLLLRGVGDTVNERASALIRALTAVEDDLSTGAIAVVESDRIRLRQLPIED